MHPAIPKALLRKSLLRLVKQNSRRTWRFNSSRSSVFCSAQLPWHVQPSYITEKGHVIIRYALCKTLWVLLLSCDVSRRKDRLFSSIRSIHGNPGNSHKAQRLGMPAFTGPTCRSEIPSLKGVLVSSLVA